ncbi:MAG: hypothetical protein WCP15_03100 [bacterium]
MSFFGLFLKKENKKSFIFEVASGTVGGAVVSFDNKFTPHIYKTQREIIPFNQSISGAELHSSMLSTLKTVYENLIPFGKDINESHVVLSSPWIISETKILSAKLPRPTVISKNFIDSMIKEEEMRFEKIYEKEGNENYKFDVVQIEKKITDIRLNGYSVVNPYEQKASSVEVPLFSSITSEKIIKELKDAVTKKTSIHKVTMHSSPLVSLFALRDISKGFSDFIYINVYGEMTDIMICTKNHISGISQFPIGTRTVLRKYIESSGKSLHLSMSEISMLIQGALSEEDVERSIILKGFNKDWADGVSVAIKTLCEKSAIPPTIYISADSSFEPGFEKILRSEVLDSLSLLEGGINILGINTAKLSTYLINENPGITDELICLTALGVSRAIQ